MGPKMKRKLNIITFLIVLSFIAGTGCSVSNQIIRLKDFIEGEDRVDMPGSTVDVSPLMTKDNVVILPPSTSSEPALTSETSEESEEPEPNTEILERAQQENVVQPLPTKSKVEVSAVKPALPQNKKAEDTTIKQDPSSPKDLGTLSGRITIGKNKKGAKGGQSIVILKPKSGQVLTHFEIENTHTIDMKDKTYLPAHIVVRADEKVEFTNSDKIRHNVFSSSGKNAFDLGTYGAGKKRSATFKEEGIVKVYCNIHPKMATFVSVVKDGISKVTDEQGNFSFEELPAGEYLVEAWNIRGETSQNITVSSDKKEQLILHIVANNIQIEDHQNKFGEKYKKKPALFEDEFY